jgi:23S rRNA (pseudouridine1915-N3)-methyltransferase
MIKIKIVSVGKTRELWLEQALAEYFKRLQKTILFECIWAKEDAHLLALVEKEEHLVCLDPAGKMMTSEEFASFFGSYMQETGSRMCFVIGGAEGLPPALKRRSKNQLLSLSSMTFTHQLTRLILIEQIYRAMEILKGSKYHKGNA